MVLLVCVGCSSSPAPETSPTPAQPAATPAPEQDAGFERYVVGGGGQHSLGSIPGSPDARYYFRFNQTEPPGEGFKFQDRELSFYFRPTPFALHFQVENRTDRTFWIEWDRCEFLSPLGERGKVAHESTRWAGRYGVQSATPLAGLQRHADYLFPLDYLVDPGASEDQLHRKLLSEGEAALQFADKSFGVDLVFRMEDQYRPYRFRFRVVNVIPK